MNRPALIDLELAPAVLCSRGPAAELAVIGAGAPLIQGAVVTGHDREEIGLLVFPSAWLRAASWSARRPGAWPSW